jgi:hypothetical protein
LALVSGGVSVGPYKDKPYPVTIEEVSHLSRPRTMNEATLSRSLRDFFTLRYAEGFVELLMENGLSADDMAMVLVGRAQIVRVLTTIKRYDLGTNLPINIFGEIAGASDVLVMRAWKKVDGESCRSAPVLVIYSEGEFDGSKNAFILSHEIYRVTNVEFSGGKVTFDAQKVDRIKNGDKRRALKRGPNCLLTRLVDVYRQMAADVADQQPDGDAVTDGDAAPLPT